LGKEFWDTAKDDPRELEHLGKGMADCMDADELLKRLSIHVGAAHTTVGMDGDRTRQFLGLGIEGMKLRAPQILTVPVGWQHYADEPQFPHCPAQLADRGRNVLQGDHCYRLQTRALLADLSHKVVIGPAECRRKLRLPHPP
jgi:hypothetical protein